MKKELNTEAILSELSESRFFQRPVPMKPPQPVPELAEPREPERKALPKPASSLPRRERQKTAMDYKVSVWISKEQFECLEDLKSEIRHKYDLPFSKQQAFLAALEEAIADYEARGAESSLVRYLKSRKDA
jgi:hypothetical protein